MPSTRRHRRLSADADPGRIAVGRVGRPHGLDGSFYVTRPAVRALTQGATVWVGDRSALITRRAGTDERPIVRLDFAEDREQAELLRGSELHVEPEALPALAEGEWWAHQLEGCEVRDGAAHVGTVVRLIALPTCEALEVSLAAGGDALVPMVQAAIRSIDGDARIIDADMTFVRGEPA